MHWVSSCCEGEKCRMCEAPAAHKVEETIFSDEPMYTHKIDGKVIIKSGRHPYTAYVCCDCFEKIFGEWTHEKAEEV